jgi:uncharacterized repeat protein (TIGR01451 family)
MNGVWTGSMAVLDAATNLYLLADDGTQHTGASNPFDVLPNTEADLGVTISASPNPVPLGSNLTYTIAVSNRGPASASAVAVSNLLPAGVTFLAATTSQGTWTNDAAWLIANLGALPSGAAAVFTVTVRVDTTGTHTHSAMVTTTQSDPNSNNNATAITVTVYRDTDGDGMWDDWELANRLDPRDATDAALDPDGDGHTNLQEFLSGTDPNDPASVLRIRRVSMSGKDVRIGFRGSQGKRYRLERLDGWETNAWTRLVDFKIGGVLNVELIDAGAAARPFGFYRIRLMR